MEVYLSADQAAFIQQRVLDGRFSSAADAIREAVGLLKEQECASTKPRPAERKSLAQLFAESPFRGLDMDFLRDKVPLRSINL